MNEQETMRADQETTGEIKLFLKGVMPFNTIDEKMLGPIAGTFSRMDFPPNEVIIKRGTFGKYYYIIMSGLVRAYLMEETGKETVLGFLGEGECFGEISLLSEEPTTANMQAIENTHCLVQSKKDFFEMLANHPEFYRHFNQVLTKRMKKLYKELLTENPGIGQVEPYLYRKQIREMVIAGQPSCTVDITIREAAGHIINSGLSALVVVDGANKIAGIIKLRQILKSVLLEGTDPDLPVASIMERTFHSIEGHNYFFDAIHRMIKHKTGELVVVDKESVKGIVTGYDLLRFRGREVLSLLRNIDEAPDYLQLNTMRGEIEKTLRALVADGALASQCCKIVSELNDKIARRVLKLCEDTCGEPPGTYAWLGLGSEGRKEQTLLTDQDNAIIFRSNDPEKSTEYFRRFSATVVDGLNQCGIPLCKGGVMATNPKYFGDLEQWKQRVDTWVSAGVERNEKELLDAYVFLDFRCVAGEQVLEEELRSDILALLKREPSYLKVMAGPVISIPVPVGFFKNFIVEKGGQHKNELNLKLYGLVPLITCIKVLSMQNGVRDTNTLERIGMLAKRGGISQDHAEIIEQALETFLTLKIRNNLNDIDKRRELSNYINPNELSTRQKQLLKEAFWAVSELQKITKEALKVTEQAFGVMR